MDGDWLIEDQRRKEKRRGLRAEVRCTSKLTKMRSVDGDNCHTVTKILMQNL